MTVLRRQYGAARIVALTLVLASLLVGAAGSLSSARAQSNIEEFRLIAPSGPYPVGRTAFQWTDPARTEIHTPDPDDMRELLVEVWYPAEPADGALLGAYIEPPMAALLEAFYGASPELATLILSNAYPDAPLSSSQDTYPVVVFDPGYSIPPRLYGALIEEFASFGYIVFAPSHTYVTGLTIMLDGTIIPSMSGEELAKVWGANSAEEPEFKDMWVPDTRFVLDQIAALNDSDPEERFSGRLDLADGVGLVGHSQGGRTVSEVCLLDDRCAAAINLDGQRSARVDLELDKPYMMVTADRGVAAFASTFEYGFEGMSADFYVVMIPRSHHGSPYDLAFTLPLMYEGELSDDLLTGQVILVDYRVFLRAFLDKYVKGEAVPLLEGPATDFPEVFILARNEPIESATANANPQPAQYGPNVGSIEIGAADVWTYEGQAGEELTLWVFAHRPANDTNQADRLRYNLMDAMLVLRGPDGSILSVNDDMAPGITDSALPDLVLPETGKYWIVVRTWQSETGGNYTLLVDSNLQQEQTEPESK